MARVGNKKFAECARAHTHTEHRMTAGHDRARV